MCATSRGDNIILVGFMGAGKTTVAGELHVAGYDLVDLDERIVGRCGKPISEIFAAEGEPFFRDCESQALADLQGVTKTVLATGGGIVGREQNWDLMRALGKIVYLRAPWEALKERLARESGRPLVDPADWGRVEALWRSRLPLYERADLVIDTQDKPPSEVAAAILQALATGGAP